MQLLNIILCYPNLLYTIYIDIIDFTRCLIVWVKDIYRKGCIIMLDSMSAYILFFWINTFPRRTLWYRYCLLSRNTDRIISLSITLTAVHLCEGGKNKFYLTQISTLTQIYHPRRTRVSKHFPLSRQQYFTTAVYLGCSTVFGLHTAQTSI